MGSCSEGSMGWCSAGVTRIRLHAFWNPTHNGKLGNAGQEDLILQLFGEIWNRCIRAQIAGKHHRSTSTIPRLCNLKAKAELLSPRLPEGVSAAFTFWGMLSLLHGGDRPGWKMHFLLPTRWDCSAGLCQGVSAQVCSNVSSSTWRKSQHYFLLSFSSRHTAMCIHVWDIQHAPCMHMSAHSRKGKKQQPEPCVLIPGS